MGKLYKTHLLTTCDLLFEAFKYNNFFELQNTLAVSKVNISK